MTIIFQLFSAADLQNLSPGQLKELRDLVRNELETSDTIRDALRERAHAVFHQLAPQSGAYSLGRPPSSPDALQSLPEQLFNPQELASLRNDPKLLKILEWAIECERNSSPHVLEAIRAKAYAWFQSLPEHAEAIPRPDAEYSPYSEKYKAMRVAVPYSDFRLEEKDWPSIINIPPKP
jgi:hypothetical protein